VLKAQTGDDIVNLLKDPKVLKTTTADATARAIKHEAIHDRGARRSADFLVAEAKKGVRKARLKGVARGLAGVGVLGLSGGALLKSFKKREKIELSIN